VLLLLLLLSQQHTDGPWRHYRMRLERHVMKTQRRPKQVTETRLTGRIETTMEVVVVVGNSWC
jgi:hypothetical protein